jgi:uncharacterized sporulation protein YeaH/YhbH (DUF444 family)
VTCFSVRVRAAEKASDPGEGDSDDAFRFVLRRDEFVDLFLDALELPEMTFAKAPASYRWMQCAS